MTKRQRKRRSSRRAAHREATADRPRVVLERKSYSEVNNGHIVPRMYQRAWESEGRKVAVHDLERGRCEPLSTKKAGTRPTPYRRRRRSGEEIDDVEACLQVVEDKATRPLRELIDGEPISDERKGGVSQLLGLQLLRGPAVFEQREELLLPMLRELGPDDLRPGVLKAHGGDIERVRARVIQAYLDPTMKLMTMLTRSVKIASVLGLMRWHILRFEGPLLAYSDHPVVLWPGAARALSSPPERQALGPLGALEVRVPIAPSVAILMNWIDRSDESEVEMSSSAAAEVNALTIAQADTEWMHLLGTEPEQAPGPYLPLSRLVERSYGPEAMSRSVRRRLAQRFIERTLKRTHVHNVEVLLEMPSAATEPRVERAA